MTTPEFIRSKRLRILACSLIVGTLILDIGYAELCWLDPATVNDSDQNYENNPERNGEILMELAHQKDQPCEMIFIGASGTQYWNAEGRAAWEKYYAPRHAFNFGVAGDKTEDVLWRLSHTNLRFLHPKIAVIFVGLNNYRDTPRDIAAGVQAVMRKVRVIFPESKIFLVSLTPNARGNLTIARANEIIRSYADKQTLFYIDLYSRMTPEGNTWKGLRPDQLHMTPQGYETWAELMEPTVQQILQDGTGEMP